MDHELFASSFNSTRAGIAIRAGAAVTRILGVPTVSIDPPKALANGQCCGVPYSTEYVCSAGSSVHVWFSNIPDVMQLECVVRVLLYWNDLIMLTWSLGQPHGYRTYFKLEEKESCLQNEECAGIEQEIAWQKA